MTYAVHAAARPSPRAPWSPPADLSGPTRAQVLPTVAVSPAGAAVVAWVDVGQVVRARVRPGPDAPWGDPEVLSGPGAGGISAAMDGAGDATVAWYGSRGVEVTTRPARTQSWSGAQVIAPAGLTEPVAVATNAAGVAVLSWGTTQPQVARQVSGAAWTPLPPPPLSTRRAAFGVAVDSAGRVLGLSVPSKESVGRALLLRSSTGRERRGRAQVVSATARAGQRALSPSIGAGRRPWPGPPCRTTARWPAIAGPMGA